MTGGLHITAEFDARLHTTVTLNAMQKQQRLRKVSAMRKCSQVEQMNITWQAP